MLPQQLTEAPHDVAAFRRRPHPPLLEPAKRSRDPPVVLRTRDGADAALRLTGGRIDRFQQLAATVRGGAGAEPVEDGLRAVSPHGPQSYFSRCRKASDLFRSAPLRHSFKISGCRGVGLLLSSVWAWYTVFCRS